MRLLFVPGIDSPESFSPPRFGEGDGTGGFFSSCPNVFQRSAGFSLIELLIAIALIAISILPLLQLYAGGLEQIHLTGARTTAQGLLQEGVERVRNSGFTETQLKDSGDLWDPPEAEPPKELNNLSWRVLREVDRDSDPLQVTVHVFQESLNKETGRKKREEIMRASILIEDLDWAENGKNVSLETVPEKFGAVLAGEKNV